MSALQERIDELRHNFSRMTQREQFMVVGGAAAGALLIMMIIGLLVNNAIGKAERRVKVKTDQLMEVLQLQDVYAASKQEHEARIRRLSRSKVRLVKLVEDAARASGVEIGQLRPEEGQPNEDGIAESRIDLRASKLSINRLEDFLNRIEASPGVVVIDRLEITKPYRQDTLNVELSITTYTSKG